MKELLFLLLFIANILFAKSEVSFKVIAINNVPKVIIDNVAYEMTEYEYPVYNATIDVEPPVKYHYSLGEYEEQFERVVEGNSTLNEFFDRKNTIVEHPVLPMAYEESSLQKKSKLYDDTFVATILIDVAEDELNNLYENSEDITLKYNNTHVIYVSPYTVKVFNNARFGLSGQSTRKADKLSYKLGNLEADDGKELFGRKSIKLRAEHMDPTLIREKIYFDMLNCLGVPSPQGAFARVFINKRDVGLFEISDDINNKHFLKNTYNKGEKYTEDNHIFKANYLRSTNYQGNLAYYGPKSENYGCYEYDGDLEGVEPMEIVEKVLVPLLNDIDQYPNTKQLNLNVEDFIKYMAMEYLTYASDNYWLNPGNVFLFKDVAKDFWYFIDQDFHISFGSGEHPKKALNTTLENYKDSLSISDGNVRALLDNVRSVPENEQFLRSVIKRLIETCFNIQAIGPRIDSYVKLIDEDMKWDYNLPKTNRNVGAYGSYGYTYDTFVYQVTENETIDYPIPIKTWIIQRSLNVANELGFDVPENYDDSLGYYYPKYASSEESDVKLKANSKESDVKLKANSKESEDDSGAISFVLGSISMKYCLFTIFIIFISILI